MRQVLILSVVSPIRVNRVRAGLPAGCALVETADWVDAVERIRTEPVQLAVVDPMRSGVPRVHEITRIRLLFPSLPLVVYTELAPEVAAVLLGLGQLGIRRALFHRFDDAPATLHSALTAELAETATRKVIEALAERLAGLPERLRLALESLMLAPTASATVDALATHAQMTRRTCERWLVRSGLPSPRTLIMVARLLYAHRLLMDPGYTVEDVARRLGFSRSRVLQTYLREVFGCTATELRVSVTVDEALRIVSRRFFDLRPVSVAS